VVVCVIGADWAGKGTIGIGLVGWDKSIIASVTGVCFAKVSSSLAIMGCFGWDFGKDNFVDIERFVGTNEVDLYKNFVATDNKVTNSANHSADYHKHWNLFHVKTHFIFEKDIYSMVGFDRLPKVDIRHLH